MNNLVQLCQLEDSLVVHNFIPLKYLLGILKDSSIKFKRISLWEDVYENYAFKEKYQLNDGTIVSVADKMQNRLYGQCWTDADESDAMWRIYSHFERNNENLAVRVSTTIGKMKEALKEQNYDIRRVIYKKQSQIEQFPPLYVYGLEKFFRDSSFVKRNEFNHEKEIRVVIENDTEKVNLLPIQVPFDFFDKYMLDPRLTDEQEGSIKNSLTSRGALSEKIHKSKLYEFNVKTIQILN